VDTDRGKLLQGILTSRDKLRSDQGFRQLFSRQGMIQLLRRAQESREPTTSFATYRNHERKFNGEQQAKPGEMHIEVSDETRRVKAIVD